MNAVCESFSICVLRIMCQGSNNHTQRLPDLFNGASRCSLDDTRFNFANLTFQMPQYSNSLRPIIPQIERAF